MREYDYYKVVEHYDGTYDEEYSMECWNELEIYDITHEACK